MRIQYKIRLYIALAMITGLLIWAVNEIAGTAVLVAFVLGIAVLSLVGVVYAHTQDYRRMDKDEFIK